MALDALLFDLDGTLIDTNGAHVESWVRAFARHGYKVSADRVRPEIGKGGDNLVPAVLGEEADKREGDALRETVTAEFTAIAESQHLRIFPGARELLDAAKARGLQIALATSSKRPQLDIIFRSAGDDLRPRFDAVVTADDVARSKPAADVVVSAVAKLRMSPAQCALVGDTPHDAGSANRAGVVTLAVGAGGTSEAGALRRAGARGVWRDAADLLAHLDEALACASPGSQSLTTARLEALMREALLVARAGAAAGEAPIGCVLAWGDGTIAARGYDRQRATGRRTAHAVMTAFEAAGAAVARMARDLIVVSTVEPCVMCTGAALASAADTIVFAHRGLPGGGVGRVAPGTSAGTHLPRVVGGVLAAESRRLLETWLATGPAAVAARYVAELVGSSTVG